jgi:hypothetical protein
MTEGLLLQLSSVLTVSASRGPGTDLFSALLAICDLAKQSRFGRLKQAERIHAQFISFC